MELTLDQVKAVIGDLYLQLIAKEAQVRSLSEALEQGAEGG